ncbi:hypothetical protein [Nitrososphaera sp.]|uniref:hypothetical protein n=1 Tax=Nitrososphaera sp. TaxID=1971748 RepID=UPI002ED9BC92
MVSVVPMSKGGSKIEAAGGVIPAAKGFPWSRMPTLTNTGSDIPSMSSQAEIIPINMGGGGSRGGGGKIINITIINQVSGGLVAEREVVQISKDMLMRELRGAGFGT